MGGDEIEQHEALLFRRLVESDEGFLDAVDEVVGVVKKLKELLFPEGGLEG